MQSVRQCNSNQAYVIDMLNEWVITQRQAKINLGYGSGSISVVSSGCTPNITPLEEGAIDTAVQYLAQNYRTEHDILLDRFMYRKSNVEIAKIHKINRDTVSKNLDFALGVIEGALIPVAFIDTAEHHI